MKKYKYSFEALLNHRQFIEDILQKEMAVLKGICEKEERHLNRLQTSRQKTLKELHQSKKSYISISEIKLYLNYLDRLAYDIKNQGKKVQKAQKNCDRKRRELLAAMKDRKALEKHKEKGLEKFKKEWNKKEIKHYDDVSIRNYGHET